jgi:DNA-binding IscR family transcriptional regulator
MTRDRRLSIALHALEHLYGAKQPKTSEALGALLKTHPVVVRRTFAGLREAGLVRAVKGHGGGWSLGRPLDRMTIRDVYDAIGIMPRFALGRPISRSGCELERAADQVLSSASSDAQALLLSRLGAVSVFHLLEVARTKHGA